MELDKYLHQSDIKLYRGILNKIFKEFDTLDPSVLSELLDKLRELHDNLDKIIQQKKTKDMYNTPYFKKIEKKEKEMEGGNRKNECINTETISLYRIGRGIWEKNNFI